MLNILFQNHRCNYVIKMVLDRKVNIVSWDTVFEDTKKLKGQGLIRVFFQLFPTIFTSKSPLLKDASHQVSFFQASPFNGFYVYPCPLIWIMFQPPHFLIYF